MQGIAETKRALIVVRTYPIPTELGIEASCTAGITSGGDWLRLFPIPYRFLAADKRFRKFQWIDVDVKRAKNDGRQESYQLISSDAIRILGEPLPTTDGWFARKRAVAPLVKHCLCCIKRERDEKGSPTLGLFRPKSIKGLRIAPAELPGWSEEQQRMLSQTDLFRTGRPSQPLEKVPFNFHYTFQCDEATCNGHTMICTDWEMGEAWRKWRHAYGPDWEAKFRQKFETEMIERNDTHFFVGTVHSKPATWILVGLFYPPRITALELFPSV